MQAKEMILERFPSLSPKMQEAARFIVDHPNEVVTTSMRTIAERAGVQPATFVRLAQQLGYPGWPQLKEAVVSDMGLQPERYGQRAKNLATRGRTHQMLDELFSTQKENLDWTASRYSETLPCAVKLIKKAKTVHVAGFRASFPVAYSFVYAYRLFRNSVQLIDGNHGGLEMQLRLIENKDVVIVTSFAPYSREAVLVIEAAKAAGASIIALTDSDASPLALEADVAILFSINSPSFFPSLTAASSITEALLALLVVDAGESGVQKLDDAEQQLLASGSYLARTSKRS